MRVVMTSKDDAHRRRHPPQYRRQRSSLSMPPPNARRMNYAIYQPPPPANCITASIYIQSPIPCMASQSSLLLLDHACEPTTSPAGGPQPSACPSQQDNSESIGVARLKLNVIKTSKLSARAMVLHIQHLIITLQAAQPSFTVQFYFNLDQILAQYHLASSTYSIGPTSSASSNKLFRSEMVIVFNQKIVKLYKF